MSGGFTRRIRTMCCVVALTAALLGWQQPWLQRAPGDACWSNKHSMIICANKYKRSRRIQLQRICQSHVNCWYESQRYYDSSLLSLQHCCISYMRKASTKIPTVAILWIPWMSKHRTGNQRSTSACDSGGGNMRERGQMCLSAWVRVTQSNNRNSKEREREREMCLQHKICQVTFYITADFFFKSQFCTTATKLRPWYFRRKAIILIFWETCPAVIAIVSLNWFSCRFSCVTHNYWQSRLLSTRPHRCSRFFAKFGRWHNDECASFWHHAYAYHFKAKAKLELH